MVLRRRSAQLAGHRRGDRWHIPVVLGRHGQGKSTPLHTHPSDESLYVVDGEILVHLDGEENSIGAGGLVIAPRTIPHAFLVLSATATMLTLHTPGSCQAFYLGASEPLTSDTERVVDFDRVRASAATNGGIEILGPPPFPRV